MHYFTECHLIVVIRVHDLQEIVHFFLWVPYSHFLDQIFELILPLLFTTHLIYDSVIVHINGLENQKEFSQELLMFSQLEIKHNLAIKPSLTF